MHAFFLAVAICAPTVPMIAPHSGCRYGTAVAAVDAVPAASYSWSIEGGTLLGGAGTERVTIALGGGDTVNLSVNIATADCSSNAASVIALRDGLAIRSFSPGDGTLGHSRTLTWEYMNGTPTSQRLSGTDFPSPLTLPAEARSYSYTAASEGAKTVTITAMSGAAPAPGRHRAVTGNGASASDCNTASATASYKVDCATPDVTIVAPSSASDTAPFVAHVNLEPFANASWTIANGTPATATGDSVTIKPTSLNPVDISVTVTAGSCSATGTKRVTISSSISCDNPSAYVLVSKNDCFGTVVQARFNGRPPFRGTWNDGVPFAAIGYTLDRSVGGGTYSIATLSDALCAGEASNSVSVTPKIMTATLTAPQGQCASGSPVVATFVGTPPFHGTWYDGTTFTTTSNTISRPITIGGSVSLEFSDATCGPKPSSNVIQFVDPGSVTFTVSQPSTCVKAGTPVKVDVTVDSVLPPFTINWSDGTQQTVTTQKFSRYVYPNGATTTIGITSAKDVACTLKIGTSPVVVNGTPNAAFGVSGSLCPGRTATAYLYTTPAAGSSISWSMGSGKITAGQGTSFINFTGTPGTTDQLSVQVTTPQGCSDSRSTSVYFPATPATPQPTLSPSSTVSLGATVTVAWTIDKNTASSYVTAPSGTFSGGYCSGSLCTSLYKPSVAGNVTLTVHVTGLCGDTVTGTTTLTVQ